MRRAYQGFSPGFTVPHLSAQPNDRRALTPAVIGRQRCRFIVLFQRHQWIFVAVYGSIRIPTFRYTYSPLTSQDIKAFA